MLKNTKNLLGVVVPSFQSVTKNYLGPLNPRFVSKNNFHWNGFSCVQYHFHTSSGATKFQIRQNSGSVEKNQVKTMALGQQGISLDQVELSLNKWLKPKALGEGWDNIGLLVGSGKYEKSDKLINNIMVCNDLRPAVLEEAVNKEVDMIIAYHPPIFSGMKSISYGTWKERIVARCIAHDISIYSPHTTLDSILGGINDRVLNALKTGNNAAAPLTPIIPSKFIDGETRGMTLTSNHADISMLFKQVPFETFEDVLISLEVDDNSASVSVFGKSGLDSVLEAVKVLDMKDLKQEEYAGQPKFGAGRIINLEEPLDLDDAVDMIKEHLGLGYVQLAYGGKPKVQSAAVCVGSGSSLLKPIAGKVADLLVTGEMSHHDILECIAANASVILCNHCSSERHYLPDLVKILKVVTGVENISVSEEDCSPLRLVL